MELNCNMAKPLITEHRVRDEKDALLYIANCQLTTVAEMAMKKKRPKYEYERQIDIAQRLVDWIKRFRIEIDEGNRVEKVLTLPVREWAKRFEPK